MSVFRTQRFTEATKKAGKSGIEQKWKQIRALMQSARKSHPSLHLIGRKKGHIRYDWLDGVARDTY